mmetsp:Transcript_3632/g.13278  ORF Transcript_3632/g.13278 Transcript_3632/m.13278 type:complete len:297 (+) Transcript_3632:3468-4358(+)
MHAAQQLQIDEHGTMSNFTSLHGKRSTRESGQNGHVARLQRSFRSVACEKRAEGLDDIVCGRIAAHPESRRHRGDEPLGAVRPRVAKQVARSSPPHRGRGCARPMRRGNPRKPAQNSDRGRCRAPRGRPPRRQLLRDHTEGSGVLSRRGLRTERSKHLLELLGTRLGVGGRNSLDRHERDVCVRSERANEEVGDAQIVEQLALRVLCFVVEDRPRVTNRVDQLCVCHCAPVNEGAGDFVFVPESRLEANQAAVRVQQQAASQPRKLVATFCRVPLSDARHVGKQRCSRLVARAVAL